QSLEVVCGKTSFVRRRGTGLKARSWRPNPAPQRAARPGRFTGGSQVRTTPQPCLDVTKLVPELRGFRKTTVRLHPRRGRVAEPGASTLGGDFVWPAQEPWPVCERHNLPLVGVLQLGKGEVPELGFRPGSDLFQLLWCPQDHDSEQPFIVAPRIFWRKASTIRE